MLMPHKNLQSHFEHSQYFEEFYGALTLKDERMDRVLLSRSFSTPVTAAPVPPPGNKRSLVRSQTKEVMDQLEGGQDNDQAADELKKCFAPSFRFVIQLEPNTLLLCASY